MQKQELQAILEELKAELATSQFSKPSSQQGLQRLIEQIDQALIDDEAIVRNALNEPLSDAVTRFEGSHPQLTSILNNIISILSNMGI
ncbi:MAG: DUF4404 family protein [Gammaproteobacteria bacterium]|nr:DUF4404 family protein [Gammaproteobacteria bacterium]